MAEFEVYAFADYSGAASEAEQRKRIAWCVGRTSSTGEVFGSGASGGSGVEKVRPVSEGRTWMVDELTTVGCTRAELVDAAFQLLCDATVAGERVLLGFDHNYSMPAGFYEAAVGEPLAAWRGLIEWLAEELGGEPRPREWAARTNAAIAKRFVTKGGPFWGPHFTPSKRAFPFAQETSRLPERRVTETRRPGMKSAYQLGGAGSVGLQSLFGMPRLRQLLRRCEETGILLHCWPFDGWTPPPHKHVMVEVYPTIYLTAAPPGNAALDPAASSAEAAAHHAGPTEAAAPKAGPAAALNAGPAPQGAAAATAARPRRTDAGDAAACVRWAREQDRLGRLGSWLAEPPGLEPDERRRVALEGWVLGVR